MPLPLQKKVLNILLKNSLEVSFNVIVIMNKELCPYWIQMAFSEYCNYTLPSVLSCSQAQLSGNFTLSKPWPTYRKFTWICSSPFLFSMTLYPRVPCYALQTKQQPSNEFTQCHTYSHSNRKVLGSKAALCGFLYSF